jgi:hypothetical protein
MFNNICLLFVLKLLYFDTPELLCDHTQGLFCDIHSLLCKHVKYESAPVVNPSCICSELNLTELWDYNWTELNFEITTAL